MGVEDPDWRSSQSSDHAAYGGIRGGLSTANASPGQRAVAAAKRKSAIRPQDRSNIHRRRPVYGRRGGDRGTPNSLVPPGMRSGTTGTRVGGSPYGAGGSYTRNYARAMAAGPNAQFELSVSRVIPKSLRQEQVRTVSLRLRGTQPFGGAVVGAGNQLVSIYADIWYQQRLLRQRRAEILGGNRRGALATRQLRPLTNRTGSGSTRPIDAIGPDPVAAASGGNQQPKSRADTVNAVAPVSAVQVATNAAQATPRAQPQARPATARSTASATALRVSWDPMRMLANALAPARNYAQATARAASRVATQFRTAVNLGLPTTLSRAGAPSSLTSLNPGLVASTLSQPQPVPQEDPCQRSRPKKRDSKPRCVNPVISRTTRDGIRTTKVRLTCPQSKLK